MAFGLLTGEPERPSVTRDALTRKIETHLEASRPAGEDGWPALITMCDAANAILEPFENEARTDREAKGDWLVWAAYSSTDYKPPEASIELAKRAIAALEHEGIFAQWDAIAEFERFARPVNLLRMGVPTSVHRNTYQELRRLTQLNIARTRLAFDQQDFDGAIHAMEQSLAVARVMFQQEGLIDQLIAASYSRSVLDLIETELARRQLTTRHCESLRKMLDRAPEPAAFERLILMDRWQELHEVARADPELRRNPDAFVEAQKDGLMQFGMRTWLGSYCMHENETHFPSIWLIDRVSRDTAFAMALPPKTLAAWLWLDDHLPKINDLAHARSSKIGLLAHARGTMDAYVLRRDALRIMLALEIYFAHHASYPESLDALVPECIPALPRDKFAPDGHFRYMQSAPDLPYRIDSEYLLYSVGLDGVDNNGAAAANESRAWLPSLFQLTKYHTLGFDYPFGTPGAF